MWWLRISARRAGRGRRSRASDGLAAHEQVVQPVDEAPDRHVLEAGLAQVGASEPSKRIITGCVIVVAVIVDTYRQQKRGKKS